MHAKKIKVLHFSPHNEDCGIGFYQEYYLEGMANSAEVENKFFEVSPLTTIHMPASELNPVLDKLKQELQHYDILHIQHDFSLYSAEFPAIVAAAKNAGKKVIVSMHASPNFFIKKDRLHGLGPHTVMHYLKQLRFRRRMIRFHVTPLMEVDLVLVHNESTVKGLQSFGVPADRIKKLPHPVYEITPPSKSTIIAENLQKKSGDIIFCTVGFIHQHKGVFDAVKALKYLPENYKLAILGGIHPTSHDIGIYNRICDLISDWGLRERVYIAGYIENEDEHNGMVQECDVCVYPYDRDYYSNVSSGALGRGFANGLPVVAYPTEVFKEVAADGQSLVLTQTFAYYELARELKRIDLKLQAERSKEYAKRLAWSKMAKEMITTYKEVIKEEG